MLKLSQLSRSPSSLQNKNIVFVIITYINWYCKNKMCFFVFSSSFYLLLYYNAISSFSPSFFCFSKKNNNNNTKKTNNFKCYLFFVMYFVFVYNKGLSYTISEHLRTDRQHCLFYSEHVRKQTIDRFYSYWKPEYPPGRTLG